MIKEGGYTCWVIKVITDKSWGIAENNEAPLTDLHSNTDWIRKRPTGHNT